MEIKGQSIKLAEIQFEQSPSLKLELIQFEQSPSLMNFGWLTIELAEIQLELSLLPVFAFTNYTFNSFYFTTHIFLISCLTYIFFSFLLPFFNLLHFLYFLFLLLTHSINYFFIILRVFFHLSLALLKY